MISYRVSDSLKLVLARVLHHLGLGAEEFLGRALDHLVLSDQLLDGVDDLLRVFHSQFNGVTEVLLEDVLSGDFHHHCKHKKQTGHRVSSPLT